MERGLAPIGYDDKFVNLHHLIQVEPGAMAEVGGAFHSKNTKVLHWLEKGQSFRTPNGRKANWPRTATGRVKPTEAEKSYDKWREGYWKIRSKDFLN